MLCFLRFYAVVLKGVVGNNIRGWWLDTDIIPAKYLAFTGGTF
jgi:hypothetical protein